MNTTRLLRIALTLQALHAGLQVINLALEVRNHMREPDDEVGVLSERAYELLEERLRDRDASVLSATASVLKDLREGADEAGTGLGGFRGLGDGIHDCTVEACGGERR